MYKRVQWGDVDNTMVMSRNISSLLIMTYPEICFESWISIMHSCIPKSVTLLHLLTDIARDSNRFCTAKLANRAKLGISTIQHVKKYNQLVICSSFSSCAQKH